MFLNWLKALLLVAGLSLTSIWANNLHSQVLHTQVRVRTDAATGSGTVIYAEQNKEGFFNVYIVTCHHVVADAINLDNDHWDPLLQKKRTIELRKPVTVEFFQWSSMPHGKLPLTAGVSAAIEIYGDKDDVALLKVETGFKPSVAKLPTRAQFKEAQAGDRAYAVGCALGIPTVITDGLLNLQGAEIDYKDYWLGSANTIFGNSGGAVFIPASELNPDFPVPKHPAKEDYFFIGIPSRISVMYGGQAITHLGWFTPAVRMYDVFERYLYDFLVPGSGKTEAQCEAERLAKREQEDKKLYR